MILLNVFTVYLLWLFVASKLFSETTSMTPEVQSCLVGRSEYRYFGSKSASSVAEPW